MARMVPWSLGYIFSHSCCEASAFGRHWPTRPRTHRRSDARRVRFKIIIILKNLDSIFVLMLLLVGGFNRKVPDASASPVWPRSSWRCTRQSRRSGCYIFSKKSLDITKREVQLVNKYIYIIYLLILSFSTYYLGWCLLVRFSAYRFRQQMKYCVSCSTMRQ